MSLNISHLKLLSLLDGANELSKINFMGIIDYDIYLIPHGLFMVCFGLQWRDLTHIRKMASLTLTQ